MEEQNINAYCSICGKGYHLCRACMEQKTFRPWRTIADSAAHYQIYMAIHGYTVTKDKKTARDELEKCDLSDSENFRPGIKAAIHRILSETEEKDGQTE